MSPDRARALGVLALLAGTCLAASGCRQDMHDQPRYEALEASRFFADGQASRKPVAGTVARGQLWEDTALATGADADGVLVTTFPVAVDRALLERGRRLYDGFCSPCHGYAGNGEGMIVQRGFKQPASFHSPRLRQVPVGYFFDVVTNGFGQMSSYASQLEPRERWAVTAWVRVLQLSQSAPAAALTAAERERLAAPGAGDAGEAGGEEAHGGGHGEGG